MRLFVLALAAGLLAGPAVAQDKGVRSDARCLIVAAAMGNTPERAQASQLMGVYFLGRMDAAGGEGQLDSVVLSEIKGMSREQLAPEAQRCAAIMKQRGAAMTALGAKLKTVAPKS